MKKKKVGISFMNFKSIIVALATLFSLPSFDNANNSNNKDNSTFISNASILDSNVKDVFNSLNSGSYDDVYINDYYQGVYFSNLNENIANNSHGTCSYVTIGMLLSFYDSYWDDSFIPEEYDVVSTSDFKTNSSGDFSIQSFYVESPGILFEPSSEVDSLSNKNYLNYCLSNCDTYFQSKLISLSQSYYGETKFENESNPFGMTFSDITGFLGYYLYDYLKLNTSQVVIETCNDSKNVKSYVIDKIKNGVPVILRSKSSTLKGHAFIAYNYDEKSDEIYVHTGWRDEESNKTLTHVSLSSTGFNELIDAISLDVKMPSSISFNYYSTSGSKGTSRNYIIPQDIEIASGNYRDELPTYRWKSLYKEKWINEYDPYFDFSILNQYSNSLFEIKDIDSKTITLSEEQWDDVLSNNANSYYAYVRLDSNTYGYFDDYYSKKSFTKPIEYDSLPQIKPNEYGFDDAYPSDEDTKNTFVSHKTSNGFNFETRRYRTGYIHNEYIVMSPIRNGFNEAFIEYRFDYAVTRIDVELSYWRETSHEWLTNSNGEASIQYYWEDKWVEKLDMLSSSTSLPTNRNSHTFYKIDFDNPVYRVRFYSNSFINYINDDNRGRICIGNMAFYPSKYNLPLSGGELDYEPSKWNDTEVYKYNCYAYALNTKQHGFMQAGGSEKHNYNNTTDYLSKSVLTEMVKLDSNNYNFTFNQTSKNIKCSENEYKIALVIAPNLDYHWYRQNSDGTWSHKPGKTNVTKFDRKNEIIYDPEICDRTTGEPKYSIFVGFFKVNINNMI
jgi:hypothetical protein